MEASMYNDDTHKKFSKENVAQTKRKLKLDLNVPFTGSKNQKPYLNPLLTSPDLNMLKLASPELEQLVLQQVPSVGHSFPHVSREHEEFAKGYVDSLEQSQNTVSQLAMCNNNIVVTSHQQYAPVSVAELEYSSPPTIKVEPPAPSGTPPLVPINMENQEMIKLERKRLRNRIAASKCRRRKLEKIGKLEDKVQQLKGENGDLQAVVNKLKDQVYALKKEVMQHVQSGCQISIATHP